MILLDIGHATLLPDGRVDNGAEANGIREAVWVLDVGLMVASSIRTLGYNVGLTRTDNSPLTVGIRTSLITDPKVVMVVSLHANAFESATARGSEVFVSNFDFNSQFLGYHISNKLKNRADAIPLRNPSVKTRLKSNGEDFYYVINEPRKVGITAVLVEPGFITNPQDAAYMKSFWGKFAIAHEISHGIHDYLRTC